MAAAIRQLAMNGVTQRIVYALRLLEEWQAMLVCFLAGAATALAFAPTGWWPVLLLTLPIYYFLTDSAPARRHALGRGFFFGYGFFMAGTYWIANALAVDMEKFGWLIPISIGGLSAVMALWFALFGWLTWWRRTGDPLADLLRFIVLWVVVEYLRSLGMFGFPWNLLGYVALESERVAQLAALTGVYGLSLLVLVLALLPVVWMKPGISERARSIYSAVVLIGLIATYGYGMARMPDEAALSDTRIRLVQPNIPQSMKWQPEGRVESLRIHARLSHLQTAAPTPNIIAWSETAMPFTLYPNGPWPSRLADAVPSGATLITGAVRADDTGSAIKLWNSIVIMQDGKWRQSYDKHQLVPFGEFMPLREVLPLDKITPGSIDFSRGTGARTVQIETVPPFSPLVCYEVIFPNMAVDETERPEWIFNATNDAWYGESPGPYQHFAMSRMRAIEQGLPVARAANTGISGIIDPYGRVLHWLPLNERGTLDQTLPKPLAPTFYAQHRETLVLIILFLGWIGSWWQLRARNR